MDELYEAPISLNFKVRIDGYDVMVTLRDLDDHEALNRMNVLTKMLEDGGATPITRPDASKSNEIYFDVAKFMLSRRPDGKYDLQLFPLLSNGEVGKYPEVRFSHTRDDVWNKIGHLVEDFDFTELPVEYQVEWKGVYELGRETPKGGRYKDLLRVEAK